MKTITAALIYIAGNAVGLLLAMLLLDGFSIDFSSFIVAVLLFSVILAVLTPIIRKQSEKRAPAIMGGIALVTIGLGLFLTSLIMPGFEMGGMSNWLIATLLVWIGSVIVTLLLPRFLGPSKSDAAPKA